MEIFCFSSNNDKLPFDVLFLALLVSRHLDVAEILVDLVVLASLLALIIKIIVEINVPIFQAILSVVVIGSVVYVAFSIGN